VRVNVFDTDQNRYAIVNFKKHDEAERALNESKVEDMFILYNHLYSNI